MSADLQLFRTAILAAIEWPDGNRRFQSDLAALHHNLTLPTDYCHEFTGKGIGYTGTTEAIEQRVGRALWEARRAEKETGRTLFVYRQGGGRQKKPTRFICNYLNPAAEALCKLVQHDPEAVPLQVKIDRHLPAAVALIPTRATTADEPKLPRRLRLLSKPPINDNGIGLSVYGVAGEALAALGHRIVPLYSAPNGVCDCKDGEKCDVARRGKHPRLLGYIQAASSSTQVIRRWWRRWPNAGVGLLTGVRMPSGLFFVSIDIDRRNFGHRVWREILEQDLGIEMPETATVITRDGWQHYFLVRAEYAPTSFSLRGAVDLKGASNIVVAPPTIRNGHGYSYDSDTPIAEATGALAEWILNGNRQPKIIGEQRHPWLVSCARRMAGDGLLESEIYGTLKVRRDTRCAKTDREIEDEELARIANWTWRIEQDQRKRGQRIA
nr:prophage Lp4 protein 7 [uncultured bacterium]